MSIEAKPRARVAVVSAADTDLPARLGALAHPLLVRRFADLYADASSIHRFAPAALFLSSPDLGEEEIGALRLIHALLPDLGAVLVCDAAREVAVRELADRAGAATLAAPYTDGELAVVVDAATASAPHPSAEALLDLARGISDEINNPLMFVDGHLQLLQRSLQAPEQRRELEQVERVRDGLARIRGTMDRVRLLAQAGSAGGTPEPIDLGLLATALAGQMVSVSAPAPAVVRGDRQLLTALVAQLARVAAALAEVGGAPHLEVRPSALSVALVALVDTRGLPQWQLPRTFEPYYLTRILRGTPHGLGLFLVQVVAQRHGGRATARWTNAGRLALEVELPRG
jgi:signal transduction histidine kinase